MGAGVLDATVSLPPGLTAPSVGKVVTYVERELSALVEVYFEQANVFSALAGIFAAKALDSLTVYEKSRHIDTAQQRFPDLKRKGSPDPPPANEALEVKASKRPWSIQSHYDHPGWYIVFRYLVDPTETLEAGRPAIIWRVDVAFLAKDDWKYEASSASAGGGGRTHTFGIKNAAARLSGCAVYKRSDVIVKGGKAVPANGD